MTAILRAKHLTFCQCRGCGDGITIKKYRSQTQLCAVCRKHRHANPLTYREYLAWRKACTIPCAYSEQV